MARKGAPSQSLTPVPLCLSCPRVFLPPRGLFLMKPGQRVETLVALVERLLCSDGKFEVVQNHRVYYERTPFAEFDVIVQGKAGSSPVKALIECRDRPSDGKAPGDWITALHGKKQYHGFTSVIAVSTTGFSTGAHEYARSFHIELRSVTSLESSVNDWFAPGWFPAGFVFNNRAVMLEYVQLFFGKELPSELVATASEAINDHTLEGKIIRVSTSGQMVSVLDLFIWHWKNRPNREAVPVGVHEVTLGCPTASQIEVAIDGSPRILFITFRFRIEDTSWEASRSASYRYASDASGDPIANVADYVGVSPTGPRALSVTIVENAGEPIMGLSSLPVP
ncbi:MAG: hypothetical protein EOP84_06195 [Verrucomicrobiaceae bacterium]|nr:MAG: hypothetical protein EOP84_06195 [Verrucomicrobiaceae bacterium]